MGVRDRVHDLVRPGHQRDANPWLGQVNHCQSDEERGRRRDLEIDDRFQAHPPDFAQVAGSGDADHDGREDKRRDDRLDQVKENVPEKIDRVAPVGPEPADESADDQPDHDLGRQRWAIPGTGRVGEFRIARGNHPDVWTNTNGSDEKPFSFRNSRRALKAVGNLVMVVTFSPLCLYH